MGDVVRVPWGYFVTGYDACNQVLRGRNWLTPDFAWQARQPDASRWEGPESQEMSRTLPRLNAPHHTYQRRSLGNPFDRGTIEGLRPMVDRHVTNLLDDLDKRLQDDGEADLVATVADPLPLRVGGSWLGIPTDRHSLLLDLAHRQVHSQELWPTKKELGISAAATVELRKFFTQLLEERRAAPKDDDVSRWIRYWDEQSEDRAAADSVVYHLLMFVTLASLETTSTMLSVAVQHLAGQPEHWRWLQAHPDHVGGAVEEALRFDPPVHLNTRVAGDDTVLAGVPISRDSTVHVMYGAANHDPRRYDQPDTFDPLRRGPNLTFGGGLHFCLGAALARLEGQILLQKLVERFPTLRVAGPPTFAPRMVFRRVSSLRVAI
jgi:cytochrome P450